MPSGYKGKKQFICVFCSKSNDWNYKSTNKYCSHSCSRAGWYRDVTLPLILEGKTSPKKLKGAVTKFLTDRDGYKCSKCNLTDWHGEQMILDIDHIDGNNENNLPSNWRFLCPNCHRMTPT
jgi:5-methylcytosine-specific restriction endonuclease McrA